MPQKLYFPIFSRIENRAKLRVHFLKLEVGKTVNQMGCKRDPRKDGIEGWMLPWNLWVQGLRHGSKNIPGFFTNKKKLTNSPY